VVLRSRWVTRFFAVQLVTYAVVGLLIAAAGLYGLISDAVLQRRHEMAIRLAMGASPSTVRQRILVQGVGLAALGVVIGLPLALGLAHLAASLLLDTSPRDPVVYLGVATLLVAVGLAASWWPAQRAAEADPVESLRAE
jgi:ABC-type antimicrobial peptide transport system permease subunit